jgi:hypothetical protein
MELAGIKRRNRGYFFKKLFLGTPQYFRHFLQKKAYPCT